MTLARAQYPHTQQYAHITQESSTTSAADESPRLVVFGGNGYVGSHVCQAALQSGLQVLAISRSGTPASGGGAWTQDVEWYKVCFLFGKVECVYFSTTLCVFSCTSIFPPLSVCFPAHIYISTTLCIFSCTHVLPPRSVCFSAQVYCHHSVYIFLHKYSTTTLCISCTRVQNPAKHTQGDALQPEQWRWVLQGALGVVSCVGAFGSNDYMLKVRWEYMGNTSNIHPTRSCSIMHSMHRILYANTGQWRCQCHNSPGNGSSWGPTHGIHQRP